MTNDNKHKLLSQIERLLAGDANLKEIKNLFNFFQSHQRINQWHDELGSKDNVGANIFEKVQKSLLIGPYKKKSKVILFFQKKLIRYAAVILLGGLMGYIFMTTQNSTTTKETLTATNHFKKGEYKAMLTLEDGSLVLLEKDSLYNSSTLYSNGQEIIYNSNTSTVDANVTAYNYLTIPRGGQFFVKLSDDTKVWLNSESQLKYPESFVKGKERTVELIYGEAYFEVSPSTEHSGTGFKVVSKNQSIEVLGTQFNLRAYDDESEVYTTLVEGSIVLENTQQKIVLKPNQQSAVGDSNAKFKVRKVDVYNEISWKEGVFSFEDKPLVEIMSVLGRWYNFNVLFENKKLEKDLFGGSFSKDQELSEILDMIKNITQADFEIKDKIILIK